MPLLPATRAGVPAQAQRRHGEGPGAPLSGLARRLGAHKPTILGGVGAAARDESLLRYWDLLEEADERRPDGGRAGWWRVTAQGGEFVREERLVPEYVVVYDSRRLRLEGRMISIRTALGNRFDLDELLGRAF